MRYMLRNVCCLLFAFLFLISCKKENSRPQWDVAVLGPVAMGSMGINNIITDSLIHVNPDSTVKVIYNKTLYSLAIDSLVKIPDTAITNSFSFPVPLTLPAGFNFPAPPNETKLSAGNVQLRYAI